MPTRSVKSENKSDSEDANASEGVREDFAIPPNAMDDLRNSFGEDEETSGADSGTGSGDKMPEATAITLSQMIVYGIDILHDELADAYSYDKVRLTDKEKEMWLYCMKQLVPNLPIKYAVLIVTVIILGLAEGRKFAGLAMEIQRRKKK